MIQRIQSLFLFLTTLVSLIFLKGSYLSFINKTGSVINITFTGIMKSTDGQAFELIQNVMPITILIPVIAALSFSIIFFFKNRSLQLLLSKILIALITILILVSGYYSYIIISQMDGAIVPGIKMVLPVIMLILSVLAFRGIKKDDQLVKSYDRLR
jgi:hypothetical protein